MARPRPPAEGGAPFPSAAAALLALPPAGFTAARDALARELSEHGDPSAAVVRKARRPVGLAWVLNHLARQEHGAVDALLGAGDRLRSAQAAALAGRGAADFRAAEEELRKAARTLRLSAAPALAAAGKGGTPAALAHLEVMLRFLAGAPGELRERVRAGLLEREPDVGAAGLSGMTLPAAPLLPPSPPPAPPARDETAARREALAQARRAEAERRKAQAAEKAHAREEAKARADAERSLAQARARVARARDQLRAAEARAEDARAALQEAEAAERRLAEADAARR